MNPNRIRRHCLNMSKHGLLNCNRKTKLQIEKIFTRGCIIGHKTLIMKIVVIGGTGLIGSKLVNKLHQLNHRVISASPESGVNTITRKGLNEALKDTDVVVDVS